MEETHRRDRKDRTLQVNVSYLAKGLGRCRRTIQRYLAMLEREGYLRVEVMSGHRSRMCIGLIVHLLEPLFPRHQRESWPQRVGNPPKNLTDDAENRRNPDATSKSQNEKVHFFKEEEIDPLLRKQPYINSYHPRFRALHYGPSCHLYSRDAWAEKCMAGIFRALLKAVPGLGHDPFCMQGEPGAGVRAGRAAFAPVAAEKERGSAGGAKGNEADKNPGIAPVEVAFHALANHASSGL